MKGMNPQKSGIRKRDPLKLDNFEVLVSMIKFTIGLGIFNRPYVYKMNGLNNGISSDVLLCAITIMSNYNLVESLRLLPRTMRRPTSGLTLGKTVGYILDERA
jgi:amino acid permease